MSGGERIVGEMSLGERSKLEKAEELIENDDLLCSTLLATPQSFHRMFVDSLGRKQPFGVTFQQSDYNTTRPCYDHREILYIINSTIIKGKFKAGADEVMDLDVIKEHLEGKDSISQRRFRTHLERYLRLFEPTGKVEIWEAERLSRLTGEMQLGVYATQNIFPSSSANYHKFLNQDKNGSSSYSSELDEDNDPFHSNKQQRKRIKRTNLQFGSSPLTATSYLKELEASMEPVPSSWRSVLDAKHTKMERRQGGGGVGIASKNSEGMVREESEASGSGTGKELGVDPSLNDERDRGVNENRIGEQGAGGDDGSGAVKAERGDIATGTTSKGEDFVVRDFSLIQTKRGLCFLLGPGRFMNHDCNPTVELASTGTDIMAAKVLRPILIGEEITTFYGSDYFGNGNAECLCLTCEKKGMGRFRGREAGKRKSKEKERELKAQSGGVDLDSPMNGSLRDQSTPSPERSSDLLRTRAGDVTTPISKSSSFAESSKQAQARISPGSTIAVKPTTSETEVSASSALAAAEMDSTSDPQTPQTEMNPDWTAKTNAMDREDREDHLSPTPSNLARLEQADILSTYVVDQEERRRGMSSFSTPTKQRTTAIASPSRTPRAAALMGKEKTTVMYHSPFGKHGHQRRMTFKDRDHSTARSESSAEERDPPDTYRCMQCLVVLRKRILNKSKNTFVDLCHRCMRHGKVFHAAWPARSLDQEQPHPPVHLRPSWWIPPPQKPQKVRWFSEIPKSRRINVDNQQTNVAPIPLARAVSPPWNLEIRTRIEEEQRIEAEKIFAEQLAWARDLQATSSTTQEEIRARTLAAESKSFKGQGKWSGGWSWAVDQDPEEENQRSKPDIEDGIRTRRGRILPSEVRASVPRSLSAFAETSSSSSTRAPFVALPGPALSPSSSNPPIIIRIPARNLAIAKGTLEERHSPRQEMSSPAEGCEEENEMASLRILIPPSAKAASEPAEDMDLSGDDHPKTPQEPITPLDQDFMEIDEYNLLQAEVSQIVMAEVTEGSTKMIRQVKVERDESADQTNSTSAGLEDDAIESFDDDDPINLCSDDEEEESMEQRKERLVGSEITPRKLDLNKEEMESAAAAASIRKSWIIDLSDGDEGMTSGERKVEDGRKLSADQDGRMIVDNVDGNGNEEEDEEEDDDDVEILQPLQLSGKAARSSTRPAVSRPELSSPTISQKRPSPESDIPLDPLMDPASSSSNRSPKRLRGLTVENRGRDVVSVQSSGSAVAATTDDGDDDVEILSDLGSEIKKTKARRSERMIRAGRSRRNPTQAASVASLSTTSSFAGSKTRHASELASASASTSRSEDDECIVTGDVGISPRKPIVLDLYEYEAAMKQRERKAGRQEKQLQSPSPSTAGHKTSNLEPESGLVPPSPKEHARQQARDFRFLGQTGYRRGQELDAVDVAEGSIEQDTGSSESARPSSRLS